MKMAQKGSRCPLASPCRPCWRRRRALRGGRLVLPLCWTQVTQRTLPGYATSDACCMSAPVIPSESSSIPTSNRFGPRWGSMEYSRADMLVDFANLCTHLLRRRVGELKRQLGQPGVVRAAGTGRTTNRLEKCGDTGMKLARFDSSVHRR